MKSVPAIHAATVHRPYSTPFFIFRNVHAREHAKGQSISRHGLAVTCTISGLGESVIAPPHVLSLDLHMAVDTRWLRQSERTVSQVPSGQRTNEPLQLRLGNHLYAADAFRAPMSASRLPAQLLARARFDKTTRCVTTGHARSTAYPQIIHRTLSKVSGSSNHG
jgi:hypothetical protein